MPTKIEWTDETWNPVTGCTPISEGCKNCYAARMANRLRGRFGYPADEPFRVTVHPDRLGDPFHWRKPRRIFVCSMGDLFHKNVPVGFIDRAFVVMAGSRRHTFIVLTKRAAELGAWCRHQRERAAREIDYVKLPLPNVWQGVSVENADNLWRIDELRHVPAAVRFLSLEPLLGALPNLDLAGIDWVIVGGETGPGARPMKPEWARAIRHDCAEAGVPFFMKQMSGKAPIPDDLMVREYPDRKESP